MSRAAWILLLGLGAALVLRRAFAGRVLDLSALTILKAPLNALRFAVRRAVGWSRGEPRLEDEPKDGLLEHLDGAPAAAAHERVDELERRYDLDALRRGSSRARYRDALYLLDTLDAAWTDLGPLAEDVLPARRVRAVDVGSKDFGYAFALQRFLAHAGSLAPRDVDLTGVEIDGHVVYRDLRSRADHGRAHARQVGAGVRYRVADFLEVDDGPFDAITMFYPFVTRFALLAWGLPLGHYEPQRIFDHAAQLLAPRGLLAVASHTSEERDRTLELAAKTGSLRLLRTAPAKSPLVDYHESVADRHLSLFRATPAEPHQTS